MLLPAALAACSDDADGPAAGPTTTSPTTAAPPESSTTTTVDPVRAQRFVDGKLTFLTPPDQPTTRATNARDCGLFVDDGWENVRCGRVTTKVGDAVWLHERNGRAERALVYVNEGPHWRLAQRASDDNGAEFDVSAQAVDVMGDGAEKIVFVFTKADPDTTDGVSPPKVVDVVEPSGGVVVHVVVDYPGGLPAARVTPGRGVEVWDCTVECTPTGPYRYRRIAFAEGRWAVVEERANRPPPD